MILVIDVGNTNIVLGVYQNDLLLQHWRISTNRSAASDEYGILIDNLFRHAGLSLHNTEGVIISSVVPPLMFAMEQMCERYVKKKPIIVGPGIKTGLNVRFENPKEVGADRIVNAAAAIELYGAPCIIVDFGTAMTFDYIDPAGQYIGGAAAPGIGISTEALYQRAAKLPRIELLKPKNVIGKNTVASMQAGIIYGFAGQVDGITERMIQEAGTHPIIIATGEMAELIAAESKWIQKVDPLLTLQGLLLIYKRNQ